MTSVYIDDRTRIIKQIGEGATATTYLVERKPQYTCHHQAEQPELFALKVFDKLQIEYSHKGSKIVDMINKKNKKLFETEVSVMKQVKSVDGMIGFQQSGSNARVKTQLGKQFQSHYIMMNFADNGQLYDLIDEFDGFGEDGARIFLQQIASSLNEMHKKDLAHLDIKPENLLVDGQLRPLIADFGTSKRSNYRQKIDEFDGTLGYQCPELVARQKYDGKKADVFALGVTLFTMTTGKFPFIDASLSDNFYRQIASGNKTEYFRMIEEVIEIKLSPKFKDLIFHMLTFEENKRATLEQVLAHPWTQQQSQSTYFESKLEEFRKPERNIATGLCPSCTIQHQNAREAHSNQNQQTIQTNPNAATRSNCQGLTWEAQLLDQVARFALTTGRFLLRATA